MTQVRSLVLIGSAFALAACSGASDVASPGEGVIVVTPTPTPQPTPPVVPNPPATPSATPENCPTGTANVGTIEAAGQTLRNCQLSGVITGNLLLPNIENLVYSLSGGVRIGMDVGADGNKAGGKQGILTIEPGVVLFGASGADFLLIERGSQIYAEGTADKPIVMTSRSNMEGKVNDDSIMQWGGLVVLGRAPIHTCIAEGATGGTVDCESRVEGAEGFYGGATANDNSGRLRYVQVRYPGFEVTPGNELNGITFAGVGSGTYAENLQVHNSSDDGIEWFGGSVNHRYVVVTGADDDSLDTDFGYRGKLQYGLVVQRTAGGDRMIEAETTGFDLRSPRSRPTFANVTFVGNRAVNGLLFRGGTDFNLWNSVIRQEKNACVQMADAFTITSDTSKDKAGAPNLRSVFMSCGGGAAAASGSLTVTQVDTILKETARNNKISDFVAADHAFPWNNGTADMTMFDAKAADSFFANTTYAGAFRDANDKWYAGWTCGVDSASVSCSAVPLPKN